MDKKSVAFDVVEGVDDRAPYATGLRQRFVAWLATNHPELGITINTQWTGTMVSPRWLAVSHYLLFSDEWEMHLPWYIMIPPSDWAEINLRHRFDQEKPTLAFRIPSLQAQDEPQAVESEESVWR
jgi:hypothetical protein